MSPLQKGVETPQVLYYYTNPAQKDGASDSLYFTNNVIITPTFMSGSKNRKNMGFIPIRSTGTGKN